MNAKGVFRLLASGLLGSEKLEFLSTHTPTLLPEVDDTALYLGDGTNSWDGRLYGSSSSAYISWDASANDLKFEDNVSIMFGTGATAGQGTAGDLEMRWDGTDFDILQTTANSSIKLGVSGAGIDLQLYGDTAAADCLWDQSADSLIFGDSAKVVFGTGSDITIAWDGTDLDVTQATANSSIKWGIDGAGIDHVFYGDTASAALTWDQSADALIFSGAASVQGQRNSTSSATAITTTRVLTLADAGGIFTVAQSSTYDIDLPSPTTGAGCRYIFQLVSPGSFAPTITVASGGATFEGVIDCDATVISATGNTLTFASGTALLGDYIEAISTSTSKYFIRAVSSAVGGITIA